MVLDFFGRLEDDFLLQKAGRIGIDELAKGRDLDLVFLAKVRIGDEDPAVIAIHGPDVRSVGFQLIRQGIEVHVLGQGDVVGVVDQGVARDPRLLLVGLGDAAVDDEEAAIGPHGGLSLFLDDRDVAVDDMALVGVQVELLEDLFGDGLFRGQGEVGVHLFFMVFLIGGEVAFEGGHLPLTEHGGLGPAPKIPHKVHRIPLPLRSLGGIVGLGDDEVQVVHEGLAGLELSVDGDAVEFPFLGHGQAAMVEEVPVHGQVGGAPGEEEGIVALESFRVKEGGLDVSKELFLLLGQLEGVLGVDGGEVGVRELVAASVDGHIFHGFPVHLLEDDPIGHLIFRVALIELALQLEFQDGHGLMHPGSLALVHHVVDILVIDFWLEDLAGVIPIDLAGKVIQDPEVDPVAVLQAVKGIVFNGIPHDGHHADLIAQGSSHPNHVVVAPLNVHLVAEVDELPHDGVGAGAPVEDVPDYMDVVDADPLDHEAEFRDEVLLDLLIQDPGDDGVIVVPSVNFAVVGFHELMEGGSVITGHLGGDLVPGVLGGDEAGHLHQLEDGIPDPAGVLEEVLTLGQGGLGVIDDRGQFVLPVLRQAGPVDVPDLPPDVSGGRPEHMEEGLILAMHVGEKVFRPLRHPHDGPEADNLSGRRHFIGEHLG